MNSSAPQFHRVQDTPIPLAGGSLEDGRLTCEQAESVLHGLAHAFGSASPDCNRSTALIALDHDAAVLSRPSRHAADERYRLLVEQLPAVTFMAALDGGINELYVSPQIESLLGFTQREWLEDPVLWYRQLHPDDRERWHTEFALTCATGKPLPLGIPLLIARR